jgi:ABC-type bacteriocin/lantibiotic exporter with double-glycine peptidase domain
MRALIRAILWRNAVRLLLVFLAVALVTWLLVWYTQPPRGNLIEDCARKDADGNWQFPVPCPWE